MRHGRPASDDGVVAVIVAILAVLLIGMAAFAVDFGNAYAVKRQLSVAADSAALAGARAVNADMPPGTACDPDALEPTALAAAQLANAQNDQSGQSTVSSVTVTCSDDDVQVSVENTRTLDTIFGGLWGASSYQPTREATAQLFVPGVASGLRPIAACEGSVLANYQPTAGVVNPFLVYVSKTDAVCGTAASGDWGFTNFLDQGTFGEYDTPGDPAFNPNETCTSGNSSAGANAGCQAVWTADGYSGPVYFPNQATGGSTGLAGNTGLANSSSWRAAFDALVDDIILLPVADTYSDQPGIDRLNVTGVVAIRVCSVNRGGTVVQGVNAECSGRRVPTANPDLAAWNDLKNNEAVIWGIPTDYVTSGVSDPRQNCLGDPSCDFGTRAVRLYQ